jgi:hypothetical protein
MKAARPAIEALAVNRQPSVETFGSHFFKRCVEQNTIFSGAANFYPRLQCVVLHSIKLLKPS